jgi:hypothetical protein
VLLYIAVLIALLGAVFLRRLSRGAAVRLKNMDA